MQFDEAVLQLKRRDAKYWAGALEVMKQQVPSTDSVYCISEVRVHFNAERSDICIGVLTGESLIMSYERDGRDGLRLIQFSQLASVTVMSKEFVGLSGAVDVLGVSGKKDFITQFISCLQDASVQILRR